MVQPRQEFLGPITVLDEDASGTVNATGAELVNVTVVLNSLAAQPTTGAGTGAFWVQNGTPTTARFTDSAGTTITLNDAGTDANAIHDNASGEILAIPEKAIPDNDDVLIIEDSNDGYSKRRLAIGSLPGGTDADAIHNNVSGEIVGITQKVSPDDSDFLIIEDSSDGYSKRRLAIGNLPGGSGGGETLEQTLAIGNTTGSNWILVENGYGINSVVDGDGVRLQAGGATSGAMQISCGSNPAGAGGNLVLASGVSTSGGFGGSVNITAGGSTDVGLGGSGGTMYLSAGNGDIDGGSINMGAGSGTDGNGGVVSIAGGAGGASGGQTHITGGIGVLAGGQVYIGAGDGSGGDGGEIYITAGTGSVTGGAVTILSGPGTNGNGGAVLINAGDSTNAAGGDTSLFAGEGQTTGGALYLYAGDAEDSNGGILALRSGTSTNGSGGNINIAAGAGVTGAGSVYFSAGNATGGTGGGFYITAGSGSVAGGYLTMTSGLGDDGYYGDTLIRGNDINLETDGLFLRAGLYRTLSFFEHTNLDGFFLPPSQAGETAMFRVSNALAFWDDTNNFYTEITDRLIPAI